MNNNQVNMNGRNKADHGATLFMCAIWYIITCIIILAGAIKCAFGESDPVDNSITAKQEVIDMAIARDSNGNGFDVIYATVKVVSARRRDEIRSRRHIRDNVSRLEKEAPLHFPDMLYTDIYDFAEFAKKYDCDPDIKILNIFVAGHDKINLYIGENPKIANSARIYDPRTRQGLQYLKSFDVYNRTRKEDRIYRYLKCSGMYGTSIADEHFSHFSEDGRMD